MQYRFGHALAVPMIVVTGFALPLMAVAQKSLEVRFQNSTRGEIVARYADGMLTTEGASDFMSGKWWTGSYSAKLSDLDLENVSYGTFTTEAAAAATLTCRGSDDCVTKKGKWTKLKCDAEICTQKLDPNGTDHSLDIWCE